jgi:hypothetical protein
MESCTALAVEHASIKNCSKGAPPSEDADGSDGAGMTTPVRLSSGNTQSWSDDDSDTSPPDTPDQHTDAAEAAASEAEAEHRAALALLQKKLERERREMYEAIAETRRLREALSAAEADRNRYQMMHKQTAAELDVSRKAACDLRRELDHEIYRRKFFQALTEELKA